MHALLLMIPSHVSFVSFLALKHLHKLAIPAVRTHACREVVRVCTYSYVFQLCIVSSMLALSAHANTRISSSHAHTRAYAQALADAFLYISSLRNVCCSCLCMQVSLICLWHSAQPSGRASRVLLTGPENRFASGRGFDTTIRRVRNEQQDLNELCLIFLHYGTHCSHSSSVRAHFRLHNVHPLLSNATSVIL